MHLGGHGSHRPVEDLTAAIERASGPGVLVLAGDVLELVAGDVRDGRTPLEGGGRVTGGRPPSEPSPPARAAGWSTCLGTTTPVSPGTRGPPLRSRKPSAAS